MRRATSAKRLRTLVSILVVAVTFLFMARSVYRNWAELRGQIASLHFVWWYLPGPFLLFIVSFILGALAWQYILARFGEHLTLGKAMQVIAYSQFGKYLPGKVWVALGRMYLARSSGIAQRHSALSILVETGYLLIAALILFLVSLPAYPALPAQLYWLIALLPLSLFLVWPKVFNRIVNLVLRLMRQPQAVLKIAPAQAAKLLLLYLASWLAQGIGLFLLVRSFQALGLRELLVFPGIFALSWIVGFIVLVAPGGLGVREGLFALLLQPIMTGAMPVVVALISRLWITLAELLVFGIVLGLDRLRAAQAPESHDCRRHNSNVKTTPDAPPSSPGVERQA